MRFVVMGRCSCCDVELQYLGADGESGVWLCGCVPK